MIDFKSSFLAELDAILITYQQVSAGQMLGVDTASYFVTSALAAIDRIAGPDSIYARNAQAHVRIYINTGSESKSTILLLGGVLTSLRNNVDRGFMTSARELIHGEIFNDFLEMAEFLLSESYKDAAAVIGGGVLEEHLRQLCTKNKIDLFDNTGAKPRPKKTSQLNDDLARQNIYSKLQQKNVIAWLDLRNKAAHAFYLEYNKEEVSIFLLGLRNFIAQYPA